MFHRANELSLKEGTTIEVTFQDGVVKQYDMACLFEKYPQLAALKDRSLFLKGRLSGFYGVRWNNDLDIEAESIYEEGKTVRIEEPAPSIMAGMAVMNARAERGISQTKLSELTGIDQADVSRIERGIANPSIATLGRIAKALDARVSIEIEFDEGAV